jgi:glycosyltransferase involved in cell wall biosynthesis
MSKLLILTSSFPRSKGDFAGNFVAEFAEAISTDYEEIHILTPASKNSLAKETWGKIKIIRFNYFWPYSFQVLDSAKDLQLLLETSILAKLQLIPFCLVFFFKAFFLAPKVDIICSHWLVPSGLLGSLLSFLLNKPHLIVEHSGALNLLCKIPIGKSLLELIGEGAQSIVLVSSELQNKLIKLTPRLRPKTSVIPMGIDCSFYKPNDNCQKENFGAKKILFLGRLVRIKGVEVLIKALSGCKNITLLIAGDGGEKESLEKLALNLNTEAKFLGSVVGIEKAELIKSSDLLVIPSIILPDGRTEGTPVVCLEAFACGKPVVASNVGGLSELINDETLGLLSKPNDEKDLQQKIFILLNDVEKCKKISKAVRVKALEYDWPKIAKQFNFLLKNKL